MTMAPFLTVMAQNAGSTPSTQQQQSAGGGDPARQEGKGQQAGNTDLTSEAKNNSSQGGQQEISPYNNDNQQGDQQQGLAATSANVNTVMSGNTPSGTSGYDSPIDTPMQTISDNSDSGMMGWITLFLALAALVVAIYNYYTLQPKKSKKRSSRQQEQASTSESRQLQNLVSQNRVLSDSINRLGSRINEIEVRLERLAKQAQSAPSPHTNNGGGGSSAQQQSNSGAVTRYATTVMGEGFSEDGLTDANSNYVIAVLSIKGDAGSFVINDLAAAQSFLISNFAYGAGRVCDIQQQNSSPTRVQTIRPGSIQRQGNSWKVTSKALISLV